MISTKDFAEELKNEVDWIRVFTLIHNIGSDLNNRQWRFLKGNIIERAIAKYSKNIKWIDAIGQDHQLRDIRIETKICIDSLTTKKGKLKKNNKTGSIKLTNTLGSSEGRTLPNTFDFLLIIDKDSVAIVAHNDINAVSNGDGLMASIPYSDLEFVIHDTNQLTKIQNISILDIVNSAIDKYIDSIP